MSEDMNEHTPRWTPDTVAALAKKLGDYAKDWHLRASTNRPIVSAASALTWALERIDEAERSASIARGAAELLGKKYVSMQDERDAANARAERARVDALEEAALAAEPKQATPCGCIEEYNGAWMHNCDCRNGGDQDSAQSWCESMNIAANIRALKTQEASK